ncbi:MAG: SDR family oxidoreductase [Stackebrandtia sp.]
MTILVTGATGTVGSAVTAELAARRIPVRALTRTPETTHFPAGVTPVGGELLDTAAMRTALDGVSGLFLLSPVAPHELTGTLNTLDLARRAEIANIVYLSVIHADTFTDPPHFAAKAAAERMIAEADLPATILRPGYYMQNDSGEKDRLLGTGTYTPPIGSRGTLMVDTRDLAEVAAISLADRDRAAGPLPRETVDVAAPDTLTGEAVATIWSEALARPITYGGGDLQVFESDIGQFVPGWMAHDLRLMFQRFQTDGMSTTTASAQRLRDLLQRPMRTYRDFAHETAAAWLS